MAGQFGTDPHSDDGGQPGKNHRYVIGMLQVTFNFYLPLYPIGTFGTLLLQVAEAQASCNQELRASPKAILVSAVLFGDSR